MQDLSTRRSATIPPHAERMVRTAGAFSSPDALDSWDAVEAEWEESWSYLTYLTYF